MAIQRMSAHEFLEYERNKEKFNQYNSLIVSALGTQLFIKGRIMAATTTEAIGKINVAGNMFLSIFQTIGYWVCIIMALVSIIKSLMSGDTKAITAIIVKFLLAFSSLYFMPFLFDLIRGIFA